MNIPPGFEVISDSCFLTQRSDGHTLEIGRIIENKFRFIAYSNDLKPEILQCYPTFTCHESVILSVEESISARIKGFTGLNSDAVNVYPNPFNEEVTIEIILSNDTEVSVEVLNQIRTI